MGKKRDNKIGYKPNPQSHIPQVTEKRQKTSEFKHELRVTPEMFEAARLMKTGVASIKDLDMSVLKKKNTPKLEIGHCEVIKIS